LGTVIFCLLSALTGVIEVGSILYAIKQYFSTTQVLLIVFAYQIGCFFPTNITLKKTSFIILGSLSLALAILCFFIPSFWFLALTVLLISPCLQMARSLYKGFIGTGKKRIFRILGFAVSPLFSPVFLSVIAIVILYIIASSKKKGAAKISMKNISFPNLIMIMHQMHYYSYAYIILIITNRLDNYNGFLTALVFVLGWITYTSAQYIFRGKHYFAYLVCGHIFLVFLLFTMVLCNSNITKIILWIFTGFGGGTVFCIKEVLKQQGQYDNHELETSENYGHILGVFASICMYIMFRNEVASIAFAGICGALTVFLVFIFRLNSKKETSYDKGK
jgi:hypothetical protein